MAVYKVMVTKCSASPNIKSGLQIIFGLILLQKQKLHVVYILIHGTVYMFTLSENRWYNLKIADSVECPPVGRAYSCILLASEVNPAMVSTVRFYDRNELHGSPDVKNCWMPNFIG